MLRLLLSRYFLSLRKRSVVGVLAWISVAGVAVSTAALVIVLSAFNGLEGLIRDLYKSWDPALRVEPKQGKFFATSAIPLAKVMAIPGVAHAELVLEDNALLRYGTGQMVVRVKGVAADFAQDRGLRNALVAGRFDFGSNERPGAVLGFGVQQALQVPLNNAFEMPQLWYPKSGAGFGVDPRSAFAKRAVMALGAFRLEKQYDEKYVFASLPLAEQLMGRPGQRSALEVDLAPDADLEVTRHQLEALAGPAFRVLSYEEQHASLVRVLKVERLVVYLSLTLILLIASFTIFTALSMLAVEKRRDLSVLLTLGAEPRLVGRLFLGLGLAISGTGAVVGAGLGLVLCMAQQYFGFVGMGMQTAIVDAYPILVRSQDLLLACLTVVAISFAVSYPPARRAMRPQR